MSATEILEHLREANPTELALVRDTADSLLAMAALNQSEKQEIDEALAESESQFLRGEGIPLCKVATKGRGFHLGRQSPCLGWGWIGGDGIANGHGGDVHPADTVIPRIVLSSIFVPNGDSQTLGPVPRNDAFVLKPSCSREV